MLEIKLKKKMLLGKGNERLRVLELDGERVLVIDCVKKTMPYWILLGALGEYEEIEETPVDVIEELGIEERKAAYARYTLIAGILPFVKNAKKRCEVITQVSEENGISKKTIRKYLCEYLASQSVMCFAPTKREKKPLTKDEKNMRKALNKHYYNMRKNSLKTAYTLMLKESYCDEEGKLFESYPTYNQFRYFYRSYNKKQTELISRGGLSSYQRDHRPLVGNGVQDFAKGVGLGMLDATICDIYLANESGGVVGRPILTACVDAFSGLCCGYSLAWEGGMYSLRDLMLNVVSDKVEHCKRFGIEIEKEMWPCERLPLRIMTDKGSEYASYHFEQLSELGVSITNLPPYRPELKGPVEKFFDCVQGYYKPYLKGKGVIEPDFQERGVRDYRKDACLTLKDFEKIILHCIIFYNSKRILENFQYTEEMLKSEVKPYACGVWKYCCEEGVNTLVKVSKEQIVFTLLPRTKAKFTRFGLSVNGMHYHNINFNEKYLGGEQVEVSYNPDDVSMVWFVDNGAYIPFDLVESRFRDKDLESVQGIKKGQRKIVNDERRNKTQAEVDLVNHIQAIVSVASPSENARIKDIRTNRSKEKRKTRKDFVREAVLNE